MIFMLLSLQGTINFREEKAFVQKWQQRLVRTFSRKARYENSYKILSTKRTNQTQQNSMQKYEDRPLGIDL